jgi:hypothetical protein
MNYPVLILSRIKYISLFCVIYFTFFTIIVNKFDEIPSERYAASVAALYRNQMYKN